MNKVIGLDLGDKRHVAVIFDADGTEHAADGMVNTMQQVKKYFEPHAGAVVVMEAGTHSGWISRLLERMGFEVWVGNPRKLRAIWDSTDKSDARDARVLGLMFRLEPRLLHRVYHRCEQTQCDLALIKSRGILVETRTKLINHVRGVVKGTGARVGACSGTSFHKKASEQVPVALKDALDVVIEQIKQLTAAIKELDQRIEKICEEKYPETQRLTQVSGVGSLTALAFVLTIEDSTSRARRISSCRSPKPATSTCASFWWVVPIIFWGRSAAPAICVPAANGSPRRAEKTASGGRWWRWPANWRCCYTGYGRTAVSMCPCVRRHNTAEAQ